MQETQEMRVGSLGREDLLEEEMAIHSSILAWRTSQTEEPGRLQSMGCRESDTNKHGAYIESNSRTCCWCFRVA